MKLLSTENEELAIISLQGNKNESSLGAEVNIGEMTFKTNTEISMERTKEGLIAHIRVPGIVKFSLLVEQQDIKALKGLMNKDVLGFAVKSLMG